MALHASCQIARHLDAGAITSDLLAALLEAPPVPLGFDGTQTMCCGRGGGLEAFAPEVSDGAARNLLERAATIGAELVVSLSLGCAAHLEYARGGRADLPEAIDLITLIERALDR